MTATATPAVEYRQCAGCGETFPILSKYGRKPQWCSERCRRAQYTPTRQQRIRLELIAAMWNDGMKRREIADALGLTPRSASALISYARGAGIEVTYRRPDSVMHAHTLASSRWGR